MSVTFPVIKSKHLRFQNSRHLSPLRSVQYLIRILVENRYVSDKSEQTCQYKHFKGGLVHYVIID